MTSYSDSVGAATYKPLAPSARWNAATLDGNDANTVAFPERSTEKIVPERSPTNKLPSGEKASPVAIPRSVAYGSALPSSPRRYTAPSNRLETYSRPSASIAIDVGFTTEEEYVSLEPLGATRKIETGTCCPRVPL